MRQSWLDFVKTADRQTRGIDSSIVCRILKRAAITLSFLLVLTVNAPVSAQDATSPTPSPESEELKKLKEQNAILEQQKKAAEFERDTAKAKKEERDATLPKASATPLEGKTEIDSGVKIESEMVAYLSMANAAERIVADMKKNTALNVQRLAIYNDRDVKALLGYMVITSQLRLMEDEYNRLMFSQPFPVANPNALEFNKSGFAALPAAATVASSVLGSFIDLIALFRTDTTVKGMNFSIEETALVSEVFRALRSNTAPPNPCTPAQPYDPAHPCDPVGYGPNISLYYPAVIPPNVDANKAFRILAKIQTLYLLKAKAEDLITKITENENKLAETKGEIKALNKRSQEIDSEISTLFLEIDTLKQINWKRPHPTPAERIADLKVRIKELQDEKAELPGKILEAKNLKSEIEQNLDDLYGQILPQVETSIQRKIEAANASRTAAGQPALTQSQVDALMTSQETALRAKLAGAQAAKGNPLTESEKVTVLGSGDKAALRAQKKESLNRLKALNGQFAKLTDELIKVDGGTGINSLTAYLQTENLTDALGCTEHATGQLVCSDAYWLQLKVLSAGGNNRVQRSLIMDVFVGPRISHSGGSIVEYVLYDLRGASKASNTFTVYQGYTKAKSIKKLANENR